MPHVETFGHFAVISSITEPLKLKSKKGSHLYGWRHIALMEIDPALKPPSRIDPRIKSIKQIITISDDFAAYTKVGYIMFNKELKRFKEKAERWDKLYPLHIVAKDWPLPLPVYVE